MKLNSILFLLQCCWFKQISIYPDYHYKQNKFRLCGKGFDNETVPPFSSTSSQIIKFLTTKTTTTTTTTMTTMMMMKRDYCMYDFQVILILESYFVQFPVQFHSAPNSCDIWIFGGNGEVSMICLWTSIGALNIILNINAQGASNRERCCLMWNYEKHKQIPVKGYVVFMPHSILFFGIKYV